MEVRLFRFLKESFCYGGQIDLLLLLGIGKSKEWVIFLFWGEWRVLDDEFDFGYVEFGLMKHYCIALWHTHSTGLNIYRDVRLFV